MPSAPSEPSSHSSLNPSSLQRARASPSPHSPPATAPGSCSPPLAEPGVALDGGGGVAGPGSLHSSCVWWNYWLQSFFRAGLRLCGMCRGARAERRWASVSIAAIQDVVRNGSWESWVRLLSLPTCICWDPRGPHVSNVNGLTSRVGPEPQPAANKSQCHLSNSVGVGGRSNCLFCGGPPLSGM